MYDYEMAVRLLARELADDQDEVAAAPLFRWTAAAWRVDVLRLLYDVMREKHGSAHTDTGQADIAGDG